MDLVFFLFFCGIVGFFILAIWGIVKFLKSSINPSGIDKAADFVEGSIGTLPASVMPIIQALEEERLTAYKRTRWLFTRAFLRTWAICTGIVLIPLVFDFVTGKATNEFSAYAFIGPAVITLIPSLIGAGIYAGNKKSTARRKFRRSFARELPDIILNEAYSHLRLVAEHLRESEFDQAGLFHSGKDTSSFLCRKKIIGTIKNNQVSIAFCTKKGIYLVQRKKGLFDKPKEFDPYQLPANSNFKPTLLSQYFTGLFVQIELAHINLAQPLRVIPPEDDRNKKFANYPKNSGGFVIDVFVEDRITVTGDKPYEIYCQDKAAARQVVTDRFIKMLDFFFGKYYHQRDTGGSVLTGPVKRGVYVCINANQLYLLVGWDKILLSPDVALGTSLLASPAIMEVYDDLHLVDQLANEAVVFKQALDG